MWRSFPAGKAAPEPGGGDGDATGSSGVRRATSQLDPLAAGDFLATLRKINAELGTTILLIEHRLEEVLAYADRVLVMENGGILALDAPEKTAVADPGQ